ncbi:MAG: peptidase S10 [Verrucomicrobia bacterium]|nr:peptidase S10 [Verrucomicrobiota bacterium]
MVLDCLRRLTQFLYIFACLLGSISSFAEKPPEEPDLRPSSTPSKEADVSPPIITEHSIKLPDGRTLNYKAITGYLLLRDTSLEKSKTGDKNAEKEKNPENLEPPKGRPKAVVFFTAYVADGSSDLSTRPITFAFNGGPGSASIWLHIGGIGPRRVLASERGEALPPPSKLIDNNATWLDKTDLVFIDPVSTGFSRAVEGEDPKQFYGYKEDVSSIGDFIRLWITRYNRWSSPRFIAGESYGTTRAAGLSDYLIDRYGISLNGLILIGTALNFQTLDMQPGNTSPYPLFLPSYAAAAWYHKKLTEDLESLSLTEFLSQAEKFAETDYLLALAQGDALPENDMGHIGEQLARFTGLAPEYLIQQHLKEPDDRFIHDLLKDQNRSIGRYDSRFTGIRLLPGTNEPDFDPSDEAVDTTMSTAFNDYVHRELNFQSDLPYERMSEVAPWRLPENRYLNAASELKKAMSRNPYLKVLVCCGYYDLATPYFAAENVVRAMNLDPTVRDNIQLAFYESGHMLYIDKTAREKLKADFDQLVDKALNPVPIENAQRSQ